MSGQSSLQCQLTTSRGSHHPHPPDQPNDSTDSASTRLPGRSNHKIKVENQDDHPVNNGPIVSSAGLPRNSSTSSSSLTTLTSSSGQSSTSSIFRNFQTRPVQPPNAPRQDAQQNVHQQQQANRPTTHPASISASSNECIRPRVQQQSTMIHTASASTSSNGPIRPRAPPQAAANTFTSDEPPEPPKRRGPGRPKKIRPSSTSEEASLPPSREQSRPRTIHTSREVSTEAKDTLSDLQYQAAPPQRRAAQAAITKVRLQQDSDDDRDSTPEDYDEDFNVPRSYSTSSASILPPESRAATLRAIRDPRANKKKEKKSRASNASSSAVNSTASSTKASTSTLTSPPEIAASSNEAEVSSSHSTAQAAVKSRKRLRPDIRSATGSNRDEDDPTTVSADGPMAWHAWSNKDVVAGMRSLYMTCAAAEAAARAAFEATGGEPGRSKLVSNGSSCQKVSDSLRCCEAMIP